MTLIELVRGDRNYFMVFHVRDAEDQIVDLSGLTIITLKVQKYGQPNILFSKIGEVVSEELGICRFKIEDELLNEAGDYCAEVEMQFLDRATTLTASGILIHVTKDLPRVVG